MNPSLHWNVKRTCIKNKTTFKKSIGTSYEERGRKEEDVRRRMGKGGGGGGRKESNRGREEEGRGGEGKNFTITLPCWLTCT